MRGHRSCSVEGCGPAKRLVRGWCNKHYLRWAKSGNPLKTKHDRFTDPEESFKARAVRVGACLEWSGSLSKQGYGRVTCGGMFVPAHRYAWERVRGPIPKGLFVDHRCHNRACVDVAHLRLVTNKQNVENYSGDRADNTSGHRNVTWNHDKGKWYIRLYHNSRSYSAGYCPPYELHVAAYRARLLRNKLFTHNDKDREQNCGA